MKFHRNISVVSIMIFMLNYVTAQYQLVTNNDKVECFFLREIPDHIAKNKIIVEGDTIIEGISYKLVYNNILKYEGNVGIGYLREDTILGKLWFKNKVGGREDLIMDLSLGVGDSFYLPKRSQNEPCNDLHLNVIDVQIIDGRKVITFEYPQINFCDYGERLQFIEGVGPNHTILHTAEDNYDFVGINYQLCTVFHADTLNYRHLNEDECEGRSSISETSLKNQQFKIYPSKINDLIHIQYIGNQIPDGIRFSAYSINGKLIFDNVINSPQQNIAASFLPPGQFIYLIKKDQMIIQSGWFIKE